MPRIQRTGTLLNSIAQRRNPNDASSWDDVPLENMSLEELYDGIRNDNIRVFYTNGDDCAITMQPVDGLAGMYPVSTDSASVNPRHLHWYNRDALERWHREGRQPGIDLLSRYPLNQGHMLPVYPEGYSGEPLRHSSDMALRLPPPAPSQYNPQMNREATDWQIDQLLRNPELMDILEQALRRRGAIIEGNAVRNSRQLGGEQQ